MARGIGKAKRAHCECGKIAGRRDPAGSATASQQSLGRDARRLLEALAQDGAAPARADLRDGFLVVAAPRNSVTAIIANTPMAAGEELAQRALARWSAHVPPRLELTEEGASHARRLAAPAGVPPLRAQHGEFVVRALEPGAQPVLVNGNADDIEFVVGEDDAGEEVGGFFDKNGVAGGGE